MAACTVTLAGAAGCGGDPAKSGSAISGGTGNTAGGSPDPGGGAPPQSGCESPATSPGVWTEIVPPAGLDGFRATDGFAVGTDNLFFVGSVYASDGTSSSTHVLHWDHGCWADELTFPASATGTGSPFRASVHGTGPTDVWAVASDLIFHRDAQGWSLFTDDGWRSKLRLPLPFGAQMDFVRVRAVGPNDIWIAATSHMLHWDGYGWTAYNLDTANYPDETASIGYAYKDIWIDGPNDISVAGGADQVGNTMEPGIVFHFDGASWTTLAIGALGPADAIWRGGPAFWVSVFTYGSNGLPATTLARLEGSSWEPVSVQGIDPDASSLLFSTLWGRGANDIWGTGDDVAHFDGQQWSLVTTAPPPTRMQFNNTVVTGDAGSVWLTSPGPRFFRQVTGP